MSYRAASRNKAMRLIVIGVMSLFFPVLGLAQNYVFGPNVRVNDDPPGRNQHSTLTGSQRMLAARGDTVYAVWKDDRTGAYFHVYFARSTDGGRSFERNVRLDSSVGDAQNPTIALDTTGTIHVCWESTDWPGGGVLYSKSTNGGRSFCPPVRVSDTTLRAMRGEPVVETSRDGRLVYILAIGGPTDTTEFWLARSTDGGRSFIQPATIVAGDSTTALKHYSFVVWRDTVVLCIWEGVYLARSFDGGRSFEPPIHAIGGGYETVMAIDSFGRIYVVGAGPYLEVSDDLGDSFAPGQQIAPDAALFPAIWVLPDGHVFVTYYFWNGLDGRYHEVRMVCSTDRGETFLPPVNPSDGPDADEESMSSVAANEEGVVFVTWEDNRNDTAGNANDVYVAAGSVTAIAEAPHRAPLTLDLSVTSVATRNVRLDYYVSRTAQAKLCVYDLNGGFVTKLTQHVIPVGRQWTSWDGTDARGRAVRSGVYFVRLETLEGSICRKAVLMKE